MSSAASLVSGRFTTTAPPKAAMRSAQKARDTASATPSSVQAAPQGLLCLRITAAGRAVRYCRMFRALSTSVRLVLPGCLPAWSMCSSVRADTSPWPGPRKATPSRVSPPPTCS